MMMRTAFAVTAIALSTGIAAAAPIDDKAFVATVIGIDLQGIELGQLARSQSIDQDVKNFGMVLVRDSTNDLSRILAVATMIGAQVPTVPAVDQQQVASQLSTLKAAAFDQQFETQMVAISTAAVALYMNQQDSADAAVAGYAKGQIETVRMHLMQAQQFKTPGNAS